MRMEKPKMTEQNTASEKIRVLIVDDHPIMRDGLSRLLAVDPEEKIVVIGQAASGEEAIKLVRLLHPQVVLLDINLPGANGLEVTGQLKTEFRDSVRVVLMTAHDDQEQIIHAMRIGASGYCSKEIETDKLIETIKSAAHGGYVIHGKLHTERSLQDWLNAQTESLGGYFAENGDHLVPLSPREMEILRCVTRGLSNKEIARELGISHQTVKNHMTNVLDKLGVEDRTQAAVYALKRGWVRIINQSQPKDDD
jgi:DNA-binding NarL/FixJ family response regulator